MQYLNRPLVLQGMRLNNRLVMPPMATAKSTAEGAVTQALCEYYRARAEGGFLGLIITEHSYVSAQGKASAGQLSAAEDGAVEGLRELVAAARRDGARVMAQINHAGCKLSCRMRKARKRGWKRLFFSENGFTAPFFVGFEPGKRGNWGAFYEAV